MTRLATPKDIPTLASRWYLEKAKTCFGGAQVEWSVDLCALSLHEAIVQSTHHLVVAERAGKIVAACAACLIRPIIPPHPLTITEYMWWGDDRKATVRVWQDCMDWGKSQGATFAHYVLNQRQSNPRKFTETYQWRALV